uniref:Bax inhibitor 1 n=1 Tax=Strigamia maritima TaxID=126957 RepID=T1JK17_STRMM
MANVGMDSFFQTLGEKLEAPIRLHLQNVYASLALSLLAAAAGGYVHVFTTILSGSFLMGLVSIGLLVALTATADNGKNQRLRLFYLIAFAFVSGLNLGPILEYAIRLDPSIISTAMIGTAVIFLCFTFSALFSNQRQYLYLTGILLSGLSIVSILGFFNLFFGSKLLFEVNLYLGLAVMCGFILYDTQLIIAKRRMGDRDFIWHSVNLFIDFINVFRYLLVLLSQKEEKQKKQK